ncbi:MAG TPA: transcription termination/antitermination protein NusG [Dehalococcoidia bacterium]|nr:transcription termination/antitermination protein NusG [Dehalococcoidia bacterium]
MQELEIENISQVGEQVAVDQEKWYAVHTYSGYEERVKKNLDQRIGSMDANQDIFRVVIPTEEEVEVKNGQRRTITRKILPGYILVQMKMNDFSWSIVRNTPGVTGFVSGGNKPVPLQDNEVKQIMRQMEAEVPKVKVGFKQGQSVKVIDGPFIDFIGTVDEIDLEKGKVKVLLSLFGRETPVKLDFLQVEKL